jgi:hypothetical protein
MVLCRAEFIRPGTNRDTTICFICLIQKFPDGVQRARMQGAIGEHHFIVQNLRVEIFPALQGNGLAPVRPGHFQSRLRGSSVHKLLIQMEVRVRLWLPKPGVRGSSRVRQRRARQQRLAKALTRRASRFAASNPLGRAISEKAAFRVAFLIVSARRLINPLLDRLHRCGQLPL